MSEIHLSEVAYFRQQQALQEEAARSGYSGYAISARHAFITARMEQAGKRILQLIEEGKIEEAHALLDTETWGVEEPGEAGAQTGRQDGTAAQDENAAQAEQKQEHGETWQEERKEHESAECAH